MRARVEGETLMKCPECQVDHDRVTDTRAVEGGVAIRRRRLCLNCNARFTTYERLEAPMKVVKKDGSRVVFDRSKLKLGLEKACWKRPISERQLEELVAKVESYVETNYENEVESHLIGELVMELLRELDKVAYVRFASVYRQFQDVHDFADALKAMQAQTEAARE
jgi:transcriptional repressor NrdR